MLACSVLLACLPIAKAAPSGPGDFAAWQARVQAARARVKALRGLLPTATQPWAGEYYEGDHLGFNLDLVVTADRFAYTVDSDVGPAGDGHGRVEPVCGGIALRPAADAAGKQLLLDTLGITLVPVQWGPRQYLVPQREFAKFASAINHGMEPDSPGLFLLRVADEKKPVKGLAGLPSGIRSLVRGTAVLVRVIAVRKLSGTHGKTGSSNVLVDDRYALELDKGTRDGVVPGMELWQSVPDAGFSTVTIEGADAHRSHGVLSYVIAGQPTPTTQWVFTTGQYPPSSSRCRCSNPPASSSSR